jgi:hypothetical protein
MAIRKAASVALIAAILIFLASCAGLAFPLQAIFYVGLGWALFLARVIPQLTINWPGVATAVGCLAGVVVGAHLFLQWLYASLPTQPDDSAPTRKWPLRRTCGVTVGVVVMFAAGICVVGMAHQFAWLMTSKEPLLESSFQDVIGRVKSINQLKNIGVGVHAYHDINHSIPPGATFDNRGRAQHSWITCLLPFVEHQWLYDQIDRSVPWDAQENRSAFTQDVLLLQVSKSRHKPDPRGYALSEYAGNAYLLSGSRQWTLDEVTDGASKTIFCGEATTQPRPWGDPVNWRDPALGISHTPDGFRGPFENMTQFVFVDGHTHGISNKIDPAVLRMLCTPAAGDAIPVTNDY